jgi:hypothetical protein
VTFTNDAQIQAGISAVNAQNVVIKSIGEELVVKGGTFLGAWYSDTARRIVAQAARDGLSIPPNKLTVAKREVEGLTEAAESTARHWLDMPGVWDSERQVGQATNFSWQEYYSDLPEPFEIALRYAMGELHAALAKLGMFSNSEGTSHSLKWQRSINNFSRMQIDKSRSAPYYPSRVEWPTELKAVGVRYAEARAERDKAIRQVELLQGEKRGEELENLWDTL